MWVRTCMPLTIKSMITLRFRRILISLLALAPLILVLLITRDRCGRVNIGHQLELKHVQLGERGELLKYSPTVTKGLPWPMPQIFNVSSDTYTLVGENYFTFTPTKARCDILDSALARYQGIIFYGKPQAMIKRPRPPRLRWKMSHTELSGLNVQILETCPDYPELDSDESYSLDVVAPTATLRANSIWGALRGLETFSQIICESKDGLRFVKKTSIVDKPRFKHRGYLVDTSRHYLSMSAIFKSLDAMAYNKFNVFHWHIVDTQSFPYGSEAFPSLSKKNAYTQHHIYTRQDVKQVIEYARLRGIRVMPEFDTPGHSRSWGSIAGLLTPCYENGEPNGLYGPINPTVDANYDFLKKFFAEVVELFPDKYVHLGGDEVNFTCWENNPEITAFMKEHQFGSNYSKLEGYYEQKLLDIMADLKAGYTVWQEIFDDKIKVKPDTIVHVWIRKKYQAELAAVTARGFKVLLSAPWYLNIERSPYGEHWKGNHGYYRVDPTDFDGTEAQKALVIGGEVCMWGEYVDSTNIIQRSWPRSSFVGERLWSSANVTSVEDAVRRLNEHRCRMIRRGLPAAPVTGPGYCEYEYDG